MIFIKRVLPLTLIFLILINLIIPNITFAGAPEEPPEMPDWWKEKYGDKQIEHEEFKDKEIKTIKPPKKVTNPTPIGIGFGLVTEYLFSQSEYYRDMEQAFWEKVNELDQSAYDYLAERGIEGWDDIFEYVSDNVIKFTDSFINVINNFFNDYDGTYTIDYNKHLLTIEPGLFSYLNSLYDGKVDDYGAFKNLVSIEGIYYQSSPNDNYMYVVYIVHDFSGTHHYIKGGRYYLSSEYYDNYSRGSSSISFTSSYLIGREFDIEKFNEAVNEARERIRSKLRDIDKKITRSEYLNTANSLEKDLTVKNHGYVPNPFGARLTNPNDVNDLRDYEYGKIEIDGNEYDIINVPNPNHTPELDPSHPNYVPTHYPIIKPVIPIPNNPDINDPLHPENPNNPYNPNNPNPVEIPEIPLIPGITPNPTPDPSPDPSPDPTPDPGEGPIPNSPENEFGEGKGCRELNLDLKSIELFTTKFPFSIPWDVYRALEAFFGNMGNEEPKFVLTFISEETVLELPEFIKEWVPLVRSLILLIFDVSIIYALYRWFGGAS